jgi:lipopolysaccharide biosynthesis glycosyltransferase
MDQIGEPPTLNQGDAMDTEQVVRWPPSARRAGGRTCGPYLLACDGAYAAQLATCLRSMVESSRSGWPLDIHVLVEDFPQSVRQKVLCSLPSGSASIRWVEADVSYFLGFATLAHISRMTFARLLIPDVMPADTSRLIYLDADIVVLHDLAPLWDIDLEGCSVGAVTDLLDERRRAEPVRFADLPQVESYFNAGVLVIDLPRWRQEQVSQKALKYLQFYPSTPCSDQDALNVACDGRWKKLDGKWNYLGHLYGRIEDLQSTQQPAVVHFVTTHKPWKATSLNPNASLYDRFRKRTLFARTPFQIASDAVQASHLRARRFLRRFWSAPG